jgi:hypothetical protein
VARGPGRERRHAHEMVDDVEGKRRQGGRRSALTEDQSIERLIKDDDDYGHPS